jgi:hypothetical protein
VDRSLKDIIMPTQEAPNNQGHQSEPNIWFADETDGADLFRGFFPVFVPHYFS